jgi:hypothetical protein
MDISFWHDRSGATRLWLQIPLRAGITVERSPDAIGFVGGTYLNLDRDGWLGIPGLNLGLRAGPTFQSRRFDAYYYDVSQAQARPGRERYEARGGYAGSGLTISITRRRDRVWVGGFLRYESLAGASFTDSPLVQSRQVLAGGFAVAWIFAKSTATAPDTIFGR